MEIKSSSASKAVRTVGDSKPKNVSKRVQAKNTINLSKERINELLTQVRALAWKGQHAQVIELATQELSRSGLKPDMQMDLLDLCSESYIAVGKLDLAVKDAKAMMKVGRIGNPAESRRGNPTYAQASFSVL